jgi:acyl-CoA synthetase (AMP-forming)/AMP-acid ligase II
MITDIQNPLLSPTSWDSTLPERLWTAGESGSSHGLTFVARNKEEAHYPWSSILNRARRMASILQESGVAFGDRVAIVLPTCIDFFDVFFGLQILGAVPVPLYPPLRLGKLDTYVDRTVAMLRAVNATMLISNKRVSKILGRVLEGYAPKLGLFTVESASLDSAKPIESWNSEISADHLAMAQFSSGTTVAPKPVGLTHRQVLSNTDIICSVVEGNIGCSWLPLYHDMGLIGCIFPAISKIGTMVLIAPEDFLRKPSLWLQSISKHKAYISPAPNFAYAYTAQRVKDSELEDVDLSCWKMALNGAEAVAPKHLRAFTERFGRIGFHEHALCPVYGLAEASLGVSFSSPEAIFTANFFDRDSMQKGIITLSAGNDGVELASVGQPLPCCAVEIRDDKGERLPENQIGEIWVDSPSVMQGYLNDAVSSIQDGWLATGDLGFYFQNELYIYGRKKDVIVLGGQNHAPQDLEMAVDGIEGVRTGCAVAVSKVSSEGEQVYLFVETTSNECDNPKLAELCKQSVIRETGVTCDLVVLLQPGTIPRTSSGKLRRSTTLHLFESGNLLPPKGVTAIRMAGVLAQSWIGHWKSRWRR